MRADIFCRVVDNYGDIGVCWRLARRLRDGRGWRIRLWVDDLRAFARLQPEVDPAAERQQVLDIDIIRWGEHPGLAPGDVVIERSPAIRRPASCRPCGNASRRRPGSTWST